MPRMVEDWEQELMQTLANLRARMLDEAAQAEERCKEYYFVARMVAFKDAAKIIAKELDRVRKKGTEARKLS